MQARSEQLQWHIVADGDMPDADLTVLLWTRSADLDTGVNWESGWWDGEAWRLCESGYACPNLVTHWADPEGPSA